MCSSPKDKSFGGFKYGSLPDQNRADDGALFPRPIKLAKENILPS